MVNKSGTYLVHQAVKDGTRSIAAGRLDDEVDGGCEGGRGGSKEQSRDGGRLHLEKTHGYLDRQVGS